MAAEHRSFAKVETRRSDQYRRLVAALPCCYCGAVGNSQAAHPNSGKAKGKKLDDRLCFPLCADRPMFRGCHSRFDAHQLLVDNQAAEDRWTQQTQDEIIRAGKWPRGLPMP